MVGAVLATCLLFVTVYGAIIPNQDEPLKRIARCDVCGQAQLRIPHPPPPPFFHTHNWSGLARNADGSQQGVFSGAAVAANDGATTSGQAFSLASSSVNGREEGGNGVNFKQSGYQHSQNSGTKHFGSNIQETQPHGFDQGQQVQANGFSSASSSQSQSSAGNTWDQTKYGSDQVGYGSGSAGRGDIHEHEKYIKNNIQAQPQGHGSNGEYLDAGQQQTQQLNFDHHSQGIKKSELSHYHNANSGFKGNSHIQRGDNDWTRGHSSESESAGSSGVGLNGAHDEGQATLHGALDLASQSLQTAQQTQQTQPGCNTCGKGNYALSNAKSKSGNAVAVSIGG